MPECDGFFDAEGIPFEAGYDDAAVYAVRSADFHDPTYKKWLIQCWFDTTYGAFVGSRFHRRDSPARMAAYLERHKYASFEQIIERPPQEATP